MGKKLHVGNLSEDTTEKDLRKLFGRLGRIVSASVSTDAATGSSKGFGFIEMKTKEATEAALLLDGSELNGRAIRVGEVRLPTANQRPATTARKRPARTATRSAARNAGRG